VFTAPQYGAITPRWLVRLLDWKPLEAGTFRRNRVDEGKAIEVTCGQVEESVLPGTYIQYEENPKEYKLGLHGLMSGHISWDRGNYEESIQESRIALEIDPDFSVGYSNLALSDAALGRLDDAEAALRQASQRKLEFPDFHIQRYMLAFLTGDKAAMDRELAEARSGPGLQGMSNAQTFVLAYSGHLEAARKMSHQAADFAHQAGRKEAEAQYEIDAALREALFGNLSKARQSAKAGPALSNSRDVEFGAAFALALSGDSSRSQALADDLDKRFPEDTKVRFSYVPTLRALSALNQHAPAKALDLLQSTIPYEDGVRASGGSEILLGVGTLYSVYLRGEAYLAAQDGRDAAAEFQKILNHRGIVMSDPIGALAHLQLGHAYALSADKDKARIAYSDFLALWKDADPGIPILKQARAEFAKLQLPS
jgi:tetratricopeptide (TPR) repeat protein